MQRLASILRIVCAKSVVNLPLASLRGKHHPPQVPNGGCVMNRQIQGLMLGCAVMLVAASGALMAHPVQLVSRVAHTVTWRDIRISIMCSEGNPLARVCTRPHAE